MDDMGSFLLFNFRYSVAACLLSFTTCEGMKRTCGQVDPGERIVLNS